MIVPSNWMKQLATLVRKEFGERVFFLGLQGSYRRGEATEQSDIDVVFILDKLSPDDFPRYRSLIAQLPEHEKACGFFCGKEELFCWPNYDVFQLLYDTQPYIGSLDELKAGIQKSDILDAIHINLSALYHTLCHSRLYAVNFAEDLASAFKFSFFLLQAIHFYRTGTYIGSKLKLLNQLSGEEKEILTVAQRREQLLIKDPEELQPYFSLLFHWCRKALCTYSSAAH